MKIIGAGNGTAIVEMTHAELQDLTGIGYTALTDYQNRLHVGKEYNIRNAWESVHKIRSAEERVVRFAKELRGIADDAESLCRKLPELVGAEGEG